jgi:hypothetical protein
MAVIVVDGKDLHLGKDVLRHIKAYHEARELDLPPDLIPGMITYGFSVVAEALRQPGGLFGEHLVELPVAELPKTPKSREQLRLQIIGHLKDTGFARPALDIRHCRVEGALALHGTFKDKHIPLGFLGPATLVATSAGALRELHKPDGERLKVFRGTNPAKAIPVWQQVHQRHEMLRAEHLTRGRKPVRKEAGASA